MYNWNISTGRRGTGHNFTSQACGPVTLVAHVTTKRDTHKVIEKFGQSAKVQD